MFLLLEMTAGKHFCQGTLIFGSKYRGVLHRLGLDDGLT
jgi:hypothetical protein